MRIFDLSPLFVDEQHSVKFSAIANAKKRLDDSTKEKENIHHTVKRAASHPKMTSEDLELLIANKL
jgi:hypothetical protein